MPCSAPRCKGAPVLMWQRLGTETESGGRIQVTASNAALTDELRRATQRDIIRDLERRLTDPDFDPKVLPALQNQIDREKATLAGIQDTVPYVDESPTLIAVKGCAHHAVTLDEATGTHEATCLVDGTCKCHIDYPTPTVA